MLTVIQQGGGTCPKCANYGFDPTSPALVYLITHPDWNAHKIGIAGVGRSGVEKPGRRLAVHSRAGWEVFKTMSFLRGSDARAVEQGVLHWLRKDMGLPPYLASGNGWPKWP